MGLGNFLGSLFSGDGSGVLGSITGLFDSFDDKNLAAAGIFSAANLVSQMFGRDVEGDQLDLARDKFEQDILEAEANRGLSREEMANRLEMARAAAGATVAAANISAGAQKSIARSRNLLEAGQTRVATREKAAEREVESLRGKPELIMQGRTAQANSARATGQIGQQAFESLMAGIQAGLRR